MQKLDLQEIFSTRKMWVWKNRRKWGTMVLFGMVERKSSISYPGHTKILQTIWNTRKTTKIQGVQHCRICDRKNYHACNGIKSTHCKHMKHKKCSEIQNAHNLLMQHFILHKLKILNLKNSLQKGSYSNEHENYLNNTLNLKELIYITNIQITLQRILNVNVTYLTCFKYYLNHEFHKLN